VPLAGNRDLPGPGNHLNAPVETQRVSALGGNRRPSEEQPVDDHEANSAGKEKQDKGSLNSSFEQVISYNIDEGDRPGGLKVRFKVTIVTGKHAAALDARQAEAIRELLLWTRQHRSQPPPPSR
jgi:hypothetical protein